MNEWLVLFLVVFFTVGGCLVGKGTTDNERKTWCSYFYQGVQVEECMVFGVNYYIERDRD